MSNKIARIIIGICMITSCGSNLNLKEKPEKVHPVYYVLCDFSASQGDKSRKTIMDNAEILFKEACSQKARVIYFNISDAQYDKPFFEYTTTAGTYSKPSVRNSLKKHVKDLNDTLHNRMLAACAAPSSYTCIIRTIEKVASALPRDVGKGKEDQPIKLVILSDLLEDCQYGSHRIDIDQADLEAATQTISQMDRPASTFLEYRNIEISLVASSQRTVNSNELNRFWKEVFKKFEYDRLDVISVSLPQWAQPGSRMTK